MYPLHRAIYEVSERITGRKARGLQTEEKGCKSQTFFISLLSGRRKQTSDMVFFSLLYSNLKRRFLLKYCAAIMTSGSPEVDYSQTLS